MAIRNAANTTVKAYEGSYEHVRDELRKLDALIRLRVAAMRGYMSDTRGVAADPNVAISHDEADRLLSRGSSKHSNESLANELTRQVEAVQGEINARLRESVREGVFLSLPALGQIFSLSPFEREALLICLAPELDRKYDRLYAYLQDDITRQRPSADLILDLLCRTDEERWNAKRLLSGEGRLFRAGILDVEDDPQSPSGSSGLAQFLKMDSRILAYILGDNALDARLRDVAKMRSSSQNDSLDTEVGNRLVNLTLAYLSKDSESFRKLVIYLRGDYGAGSLELAQGLCQQIGRDLLCVDMETLAARSDAEFLLRLAFRDALLRQCVVYLDDFDSLFNEDGSTHPLLKDLPALVNEYGWLTLLSGEKSWPLRGIFEDAAFQEIVMPVPDVPQRVALWEGTLSGIAEDKASEWAIELSRQFKLTSGQIDDAVKSAQNAQAMRGGDAISLDDLYEACRGQSNSNLGELAVKTEPRYGWDDLILPPSQVEQLREVCNHARRSYQVFSEWGLEGKVGYGRGVSALFTGPPGTGKTMAAQVIARELRLDLYRIDLSGVVSKYIGETEKNLSKIFKEAETSNAILFFDEADALFGKRTDVSDAHDRYANIETSYLLQKMEEYEGVVILSTNFQENMDEAFMRRIRFIIEFPFPDAASRMRIWKTHFPSDAPTGKIDYKSLSEEYAIAGGSIKNVVLSAAFYAADDGEAIGMAQILRGVRREYEKIGKVWSEV